MQLETINRLYLELSQFATAQTSKELALRGQLDAVDQALWPEGKPANYEPDRAVRIRALVRIRSQKVKAP